MTNTEGIICGALSLAGFLAFVVFMRNQILNAPTIEDEREIQIQDDELTPDDLTEIGGMDLKNVGKQNVGKQNKKYGSKKQRN